MPKNDYQKGSIEISTTAAVVIVAAFAAAVSVVVTSRYYEGLNPATQISVLSPQLTPIATPPTTPSPTPVIDEKTAGWQTYKSDKYGYEIKYPSDWNHSSDVMADIFNKKSIENSIERNCTFAVYPVQTSNFESYLNSYYILNPKRTVINVGNISIIKIESSPEKGFYGDYGIKRDDQEDFSFHITTTIEKIANKVAFGTVKDQNCIDTFGQILSTFKFIEKSIIGDDQASAKLFCQSLVGSGLKLNTFNYYNNNENEKFADCGIGDNQGGTHIIVKYISGSWMKIWSGNGDITKEEIIKYSIPTEIKAAAWYNIYKAVTYTNTKYGFTISLSDSWKGYSILTESWRGTTTDGKFTQYTGPQIVIRNPKWTAAKPWQDIPIMVFTKAEWKLIEENGLAVSAAPIGPMKLDENEKYVFALPPRWVGFTDALGQDEAQTIAKTIKAFSL